MSTNPRSQRGSPEELAQALRRKRSSWFLGLDREQVIKAFFGGNAFVALIILGLITIFLFREGLAFFEQHERQLRLYREAGLEYVNFVIEQNDDFLELARQASELDLEQQQRLFDRFRREEANKPAFAGATENELLDAEYAYMEERYSWETRGWFFDLRDLGDPLTDLMIEWRDKVRTQRDRWVVNVDRRKGIAASRRALARLQGEGARVQERIIALYNDLRGDSGEAMDLKEELERIEREIARKRKELNDTVVVPIDLETTVEEVREQFPRFVEINEELIAGAREALENAPELPSPELQQRFEQVREGLESFIAETEERQKAMKEWERTEPYTWGASLWYFLFGTQWNSGSAFQQFFGLLPLLTGSLLISGIALALAIPFGVGMAIYVNQFAARRERELLKPAVEFISAFPSVVLGFFGIVVWSTVMVNLSESPALSWLPGFPIEARLNAFTAGSLLALMAVPTIFSLAEDALNNVPGVFKEASFAMGATRWQTALRVIVPTALSGIISAVLLGFGRVIGETMVVLLVAGNRPEIPPVLSEGMGAAFAPVHTMTGSIAGGLGEAETGSIHYRALFCVGIVLFFVSLLINFSAQRILRRFQKV